MMCLQAHYRSELEFSWEGLGAALTRLKRMVMAVEKLREQSPDGEGTPSGDDLGHAETVQRLVGNTFTDAILDDLNTPIALIAFEETITNKRKLDPRSRRAVIAAMDAVMGFDLLHLRRKQARAAKDFATSDAIRDSRAAAGVEVMDGDPLGWEWKL